MLKNRRAVLVAAIVSLEHQIRSKKRLKKHPSKNMLHIIHYIYVYTMYIYAQMEKIKNISFPHISKSSKIAK